MRRSREAETRFWSDELPLDMCLGLACGLLAALIAAPVAYFAALHYLAHSHTLDAGQHRGAAAFLASLAALSAGAGSTVAIFLFRVFRRLYRDPL